MRKRAIDSVARRLGHERGGAQLFIASGAASIAGRAKPSSTSLPAAGNPPGGKRNPCSLLPHPHPTGVCTPFARDAVWSPNPRVGPRLCTPKRRELEGGSPGLPAARGEHGCSPGIVLHPSGCWALPAPTTEHPKTCSHGGAGGGRRRVIASAQEHQPHRCTARAKVAF